MWESESDAGERGLVPVLGVGGSERHDGLKTDGFVRRDHSWYVNSDIPSDLLVKVGDVSFHLHKYPMISRSGKMGRVIYESATSAASASAAALDPDTAVAELDDLPGGADSFELAARFCYGMAVDLTASNISGLRCAAEYLEMTEDLEEGNLIFKTEAFLSYVVLSSWRDSIVVLKSCEGLSPWAENLQIVKISNALAGSSALKAAPDGGTTSAPTRRQLLDATPQSFQEGWAAAKKDINTLKFELESMKAKYLELQHDMDALQKQVTQSPAGEHGGKVGGGGGKAQQQQGRRGPAGTGTRRRRARRPGRRRGGGGTPSRDGSIDRAT
ncbi:unnamed protein product [Triticum turgidum subsp. durum]|uniref:NPH3 domain-containing protein n=1 Tax=Triticum turgidum subsp. durum TaxID=4567 RepID=A0A9R1B7Q0_TRITD|nr:unnamed protein product [Triticum turgidum subsp. durum]